MNKMKTNWLLIGQSIAVLLRNKKLLLFPAIMHCLSLLVILVVFSDVFVLIFKPPYNSSQYWKSISKMVFNETEYFNAKPPTKMVKEEKVSFKNTDDSNEIQKPKANNNKYWVVGRIISLFIIFILGLIFLMPFYETAIFNEIIHALNGRSVSLLSGIKFAISKKNSLIVWGLNWANFNMSPRKTQKKLRPMENFSENFWPRVNFFAIPFLIRDEKKKLPKEIMESSEDLFKEKLNEGYLGSLGLSLFFIICFCSISFLYLMMGSWLLIVLENPEIPIIVIVFLWAISFVTFSCIHMAIIRIYQSSLYLYASEGVLPLGFDEEVENKVWQVKKENS